MSHFTRRPLTFLFSAVLWALLLGITACQQAGQPTSVTPSPAPVRTPPTPFLDKGVTVWLSFDPSGKATPSPDKLPISAGEHEYVEWRQMPGGPSYPFDIDFVDPTGDKCKGQPTPPQRLPKPNCNQLKHCRTIVPAPDYYGCHAYQITVHKDGTDIKTDPEIEVDR